MSGHTKCKAALVAATLVLAAPLLTRADTISVSGGAHFAGAVGEGFRISGPGLSVYFSTCDAPNHLGFSTGGGVGGRTDGDCLTGGGAYGSLSGNGLIGGVSWIPISCDPPQVSAPIPGEDGVAWFSESCSATFIGGFIAEDMPSRTPVFSGTVTGTGSVGYAGLAFPSANGAYKPNLTISFGGSFTGTADIELPDPTVPEPGTLILIALGIVGLLAARKSKVA